MTPADPIAVAVEIGEILGRLGIPYVIGGSVAASIGGEPRSTLDLDIMIDCDVETTRRLVFELEKLTYVDQESALGAAERKASFNAIHFGTSLKIEFFFAEERRFAHHAIKHRQTVRINEADLSFYAVEDLVVRKLWWFRLGNERSDRQWRDVVGMLRLNRDRLDWNRMERSSEDADVLDLLHRARTETG